MKHRANGLVSSVSAVVVRCTIHNHIPGYRRIREDEFKDRLYRSGKRSEVIGGSMNQHSYEFFGDLTVTVLGEGGRTSRQFRQMYDHFATSTPVDDPDIIVEETTADVEAEIVLGDPNDHYGWTGEEFVIRNGSDFMAVEPGWDHLKVTHGFEPFYTIYPIEFRIRQERAATGQALIHASGVRFDGQTTLFPAWRGAGKTNILLSLLRQGADFLSDDRLWVSADGTAVGYPLGVNLQPYNIESFPEIERQYATNVARLRGEVYDFIDARVDRTGSLPETAVSYLNDAYLDDSGREFTNISDRYPRSEYLEEASVDNVVFLEAAPKMETFSVERISTEAAMSATSAICNFEWDGRLREYFHAYDSLVDGGSMVAALDAVVEQERAAFRELFEGVSTYHAAIPRKRNWSEHNLDTDIVETVKSLDSPHKIEAMD
ncbi:hypothetical protein [Halobaculum halobium]|uniref:hypothetical protein n=1 Tax=Halobaculum halobium TaxID=3032281 RepID=UPI0024C4A31D|nr:hypothetical protein [Halobaculum sp. SYNS20]